MILLLIDTDSLMHYDDRDSSASESEDDIILDEKSVEQALRSLLSSLERDHVNKQLLESVLSSYSTLTNIASEKGALHILPTIDVSTVAAITSLFTPWKNVIERVQATNTPSLHIVVTSYWYLFECLVVTKDEAADKAATGLIFFKRRTQQLLRAMFSLHDLHWIAAILNPRTRMLKRATDVERTHANCLVKAEITKIIETHQIDYNSPLLSSGNASSSPPS
ncbi:unnamed protein product [Rotaria socialis]|uniref:Uncharacterized protein n=1 Tax=Rotaria socialis TaxID=392032 RepID=A0A817TQM0_9BILA|nr:unnamed protein product [Rotaria socialis]